KDQFVLSLMVRAAAEGAGLLRSDMDVITLGPWSISKSEMDALDVPRASAAMEMIATQTLAITLDTALETVFPDRLRSYDQADRDYFCFVRCLRNAFSHDPFAPTWHLKDQAYRRSYVLLGDWRKDLSARHDTPVEARDYGYAGGL